MKCLSHSIRFTCCLNRIHAYTYKQKVSWQQDHLLKSTSQVALMTIFEKLLLEK